MKHRRYVHDCELCRYLGQHEEYDLYFCAYGGPGPTVVARYGNRPSDYSAGLIFGQSNDARARRAAYQLAVKAGYIQPDEVE